MNRDFVTEIVGVVSEVVALDAGTQQRIEQTIRCRFAGERLPIYQSRPAGPDDVLRQIDHGLRAGKSVAQIAEEMGRHRSMLYKHLKKSRSERKRGDNPPG